jgi:hypothetical protein
LKKPQALFGLLAALGTAIGVLIAVVGLPYGQTDYSAFAEVYHGTVDAGGTVHVAVDCDTTDLATDSLCVVPLPGGGSTTVNVTVGNESGLGDIVLGTFNFNLTHADDSRLDAPAVGAGLDANPDFIADATDLPDWACGPPAPDNDQNPLVADPGQSSFISCFNGVGTGPTIVDGGSHLPLAQVTYNIPLTAAVGVVPLVLSKVAVFDDSLSPVHKCLPGVDICIDGALSFENAPTFTPTATNTPSGPTNTPTATNTPPAGPFIEKVPEGGVEIPGGWKANLWICEMGPCDGPGEGSLRVVERAYNIQSDYDNDGILDSADPDIAGTGLSNVNLGLGGYEFSVEYDNFVIQSVNPCDIIFGLNGPNPDGAGANRGPVDELESSQPANGDCVDDVDGSLDGTCAMSLVLENIVHFGCVTSGMLPLGPGGPGPFDLASLELIPHPDLNNDLFPGNNNGVLTVIKDNGCELVDVLGHPVAGSVNGGLTVECRDLAVTVRILEGDLDLDCDVDITDAQAIASHFGAFFGGLLYSKWLDLEPQFHDLDIDIKDVQKVFGRQGSTCNPEVGPPPTTGPIPAQPPLDPPTGFGG